MSVDMAKHHEIVWETEDGIGHVDSPSGRIWDLRRGDADDNRTSPYGRGWRNVVISTALEFNYLTATIAFVALIIVPALLVGRWVLRRRCFSRTAVRSSTPRA